MSDSPILLLLLLPDDREFARIAEMLDETGLQCKLHRHLSYQHALAELRARRFDAVIVASTIDQRKGIELIGDAQSERIHVPFLLILDRTDLEADPYVDLEMIGRGAADALVGDELTPGILRHAVRMAIARSPRLEALHLSREQYRAAWEYSTDAIAILDREGRISAVNPSFYTLFPYAPADIIGEHFKMLFIQEEQSEKSAAFLEHFQRGESLPRFETTIRTPDGEAHVIEAQADFIIHGGRNVAMLAVARDVTERKRIEEALKKSEEEFRLLIEQALDIITILEVDGTIRYESPSVTHVLGYELDEIVGQNAFSYIHHEDLPNVLRVFMDALSIPGATRRVEYRFLHRDGTWRFLETLGTNLIHHPHVAGVVVNSRDVTERRRAEQELQEANDRLETRVLERTREIVEVMAKLEEAHLQQRQFVANASHDLRTPLAVIRTELDLFQMGGPIDSRTEKTLQRVAAELRMLEQLAEDLLMLATIDQHMPADRSHRVRLDEFLLECIARLTKISQEKNISWDIQIDEPVELRCDSSSLDRAITNVLNNAIKYSYDGGTIRVRLRLRGGDAVVVVADQGPGIPEHDLPNVFNRFYRGDQARNTPGTGLGLAIVKGIVEAHQGTVRIGSRNGNGTTVTIELPVLESVSAVKEI
jgi:PAS domain S-box-containing protein